MAVYDVSHIKVGDSFEDVAVLFSQIHRSHPTFRFTKEHLEAIVTMCKEGNAIVADRLLRLPFKIED